MRDQPTGEALLVSASSLLRNEILPSLSADQKYILLMVLNAMSIAQRQLKYGDAPEAQELEKLNTLLDENFDSVRSANKKLADLVRTGAGDPGQPLRHSLLVHLKEVGRQRLLESNPKALNN
jgi:hypothetical protein|uniref:DUF6285 domain-containing protein n=1 Tax=Polynucleobacter sp. TaxID=2029855 RepID=UPI004048B25B